MQVIAQTGLIAASFFGGWEIVLILAVVLTLFAAKRLPDLARGLGKGLHQFRKETMNFGEGVDEAASDAGKSLGGIHGKPAYEALTPNNQTAELYDPAVLRDQQQPGEGTQNVGVFCWRRLSRGFPGGFGISFQTCSTGRRPNAASILSSRGVRSSPGPGLLPRRPDRTTKQK